jgi:hypothetical protein
VSSPVVPWQGDSSASRGEVLSSLTPVQNYQLTLSFPYNIAARTT